MDDISKAQTLATLDRCLEKQQLSTISVVLTRIMRVIDDPNSNAADLAAIFEMDQTSSVNLLNIANSSYFKTSSVAVDNIKTAIVRVGYNADE